MKIAEVTTREFTGSNRSTIVEVLILSGIKSSNYIASAKKGDMVRLINLMTLKAKEVGEQKALGRGGDVINVMRHLM